jgi:hypothetical protein
VRAYVEYHSEACTFKARVEKAERERDDERNRAERAGDLVAEFRKREESRDRIREFSWARARAAKVWQAEAMKAEAMKAQARACGSCADRAEEADAELTRLRDGIEALAGKWEGDRLNTGIDKEAAAYLLRALLDGDDT